MIFCSWISRDSSLPSLASRLLNSGVLKGTGSAPRSPYRALVAGKANALPSSRFMRATTSGGVPLGAHMPNQMSSSAPLKPLVDLPVMGEIAEKMVRDAIEALVNKDCVLAGLVLEEEKKVDAYRDQIFRVLLTYMMADPSTIPRALALILISRSLERVGDHATNIAEEVIYMVEGREVRHRYEIRNREAQTQTSQDLKENS